jgi:hypothetical protein
MLSPAHGVGLFRLRKHSMLATVRSAKWEAKHTGFTPPMLLQRPHGLPRTTPDGADSSCATVCGNGVLLWILHVVAHER